MSRIGNLDGVEQNDDNDSDDSGSAEQHQTLVANVYDSRGGPGSKYKDINDWDDISDSDLELSYDVTRGSGFLREFFKNNKTSVTITSSGDHMEWYAQFQRHLAHHIAGILGRETVGSYGDVEQDVLGSAPLMEFLGFSGEQLMDYFRQNPEVLDTLDFEEMAELMEESDEEEAEPAAADD